ncbi:class I SAM-dependent methyltransferase [Sphingomonas sp.]|uniref:class I SAM-dependent methyltransferase n=1 Tax=Sphingomonas sp. TaxID=28214 RepID=UPI00286BF2FD|nr:class I SAM-dependent methyltransferase [Sphingomonas sp.]
MSGITDEELQPMISEYVHASDHSDSGVPPRFGEKMNHDRWSAGIRRVCQMGDFNGKHVLEVGCGFGWDAVGLSLIGDNQVVATDILPSMIDGVEQCLAKARGKPLNVTPLQGDICTLDLPAESFDGIYSSEAVEHVHDLGAMFDRCFALLKRGGTRIIINDSNRFNTAFRESTFDVWKERDESWEHADWLKREIRPVDHKDAKPYGAMRAEIIDVVAPGIDAAIRDRLIASTAGMMRSQIETAVPAALASGVYPDRPTFSWCRNPETGEYAERLLDPFEMKEMLKAAGFKVTLQHLFRKFPHRLLNSFAFRPLNEFLFDHCPQFALVAHKPG